MPPTHSAQSMTPRSAAGQDLAAGEVDRAHAHLGVDLGVDAGLTALHTLEVGEVLDRPLEPAERLGAARERRQRDDVQLQHVLVELLVQLEPAALVHPAEDVDEVHPEVAAGAAGEEHGRLVLADPVVGDGVGAVDDLLAGGVEDLEGGDDRPGAAAASIFSVPPESLSTRSATNLRWSKIVSEAGQLAWIFRTTGAWARADRGGPEGQRQDAPEHDGESDGRQDRRRGDWS